MNDEATADFGQLLRENRLAARLTQEDLAERAGMGVRSLQALERGESKPLQDTLHRLTAALALAPEQHASFTAAARPTPRRRVSSTLAQAGSPSALAPRQPTLPRQSAGLGSLPIPLTSFVGREQELREITQLLAGARLLTLTGPGGTGKTRLALQVAAAVRAQFAGGVTFVSLAALGDPALVAVTIASALAIQQNEELSLTDALIDSLHARQLLLVLDNFEQVVEAAPLVAAVIAGCPAVRVLVTSRMSLHLSGEQEYAVPPLPLPADEEWLSGDPLRLAESPAVALFVQRAQLVRPEFALTAETAPVVGEICRRLDGLPLAIELAAARIKLLTPTALLARLDQRLQVLKGGPQDLPERQQTLRGAMDWSYDLLSPAEQRLLRRLAIFSGGWTLEAAEEICGSDDLEGEVLDVLASLVDKSLIVAMADATGDTRYGVLQTIRVYALERLESSGEAEELRGRHAEYYRQLARLATPEPGRWVNATWVAWAKREQNNLRGALAWAHDHCEVEMEMRLMVPLIGLCRLNEAQEQLEHLLGLRQPYRDQVQPELLMHSLRGLAGSLWQRGEYERAITQVEECLSYCDARGMTAYISTSLDLLGHISCDMGNYERATALYQDLLTRAREAGDRSAEMRALLGLGDVARGHAEATQIVAMCEASLAVSREIGDPEAEGYSLHNLGIAAWLQQDLPRAEALLAGSRGLLQDMGVPESGHPEVLTTGGRIDCEQGRLEQARAAFVQSLVQAHQFGPFFVVPDNLEELASLAILNERAEAAVQLFAVAQTLRRARKMRPIAMHEARHNRARTEARAMLGERTFEAATVTGQAMRLEDAIRLAVEASMLSEPVS